MRVGSCSPNLICVVACVITIFYGICNGERVQRFPLSVHPDVRVVRQHLWRNMARDAHNGLVARLGPGKLSNRMVAKIVKTEPLSRALNLADIDLALLILASFARVLHETALRALDGPGKPSPSGSPARLSPSWINLVVLASK
jgi:hypothetical protein